MTSMVLRIEHKIKPGIFDEKRGNAALLIKNSGFCFVRNPKNTGFIFWSASQSRQRLLSSP